MKAELLFTYEEANPFKKQRLHTHLIYQYRGYQYEVIVSHNGYEGFSQAQQHTLAQDKIDQTIANKGVNNYTGKGANEDLQDFFNLIGI